MKKISFILPSRDNLKYLKWSYAALRKNIDPTHEICVADDFSSDGTWAWCQETMKTDSHFKAIRNDGPTRLGHTILYDRLINEVATNEIVMIYHADMYACPGFDQHIDRLIAPGVVVSLTRIEPPLHPPGPEKILMDFKTEPELFPETAFYHWFNDTREQRKGKITEGIFAPWAIYKSDFQSIGGHDPLYAPQSKEDSDIFNRFLLAGYKFVQTWDGCVYHMTCRGSRFNPTLTTVGTNSNEWEAQNIRSTRNFLRKWGSFIVHDHLMKPIVPPKYDIGFVVKNLPTPNFLATLEPWCSTIFIDDGKVVSDYIEFEQKNTMFDLKKRVKLRSVYYPTNDVIVEFDAKEITQNKLEFIAKLPEILKDSGEVGVMEYDIFRITINSLNTYEKTLIKLNNENYRRLLV
jgi:glycosyltransferase involved in cell wall biosynthesis